MTDTAQILMDEIARLKQALAAAKYETLSQVISYHDSYVTLFSDLVKNSQFPVIVNLDETARDEHVRSRIHFQNLALQYKNECEILPE